MLKKLIQTPNGKLYLLLIVSLVVFAIFAVIYAKTYFAYYKELYNFRKDLISSLTQNEVRKPEYVLGDPYEGSLNSKIVVFEYSDLSCEACKAVEPELKKMVDFYGPGKIALIWKDFPITPADENILAHESLHCANDQAAFTQYKELLYKNQSQYSKALFLQTAKELSLDQTEFTNCLETRKYQTVVENNYRDGLRIGLDSAPTIFINNTEVTNGYSFENFRKIAEQTK